MSTPQDHKTAPNAFEAAKSIAEKLGDFEKAEQERILRWVAESLGIQLAAPMSAPQPAYHTLPPTHGGGPPPLPYPAVRPKDIKTFKEEKQPKSDNQYAAVVAYYYRFEAPEGQRRDTINAETLQESTRQSGWKRLAAPGMTLTNAMTQGYLDRVDRGEYRINTVGENLVAMTLPGGGDNGGAARKRGGRKRAAKKAAKKVGKKARKGGGE
jgi:hypothetical protein